MISDILGHKHSEEPEIFTKELADRRFVISEEHSYWIDGILRDNLNRSIESVKKDFDSFIIVCGREGFGKSTIAMQMARYCDPTFDLKRVVFTADQFMEAVTNAKRYEAIVFDESMGYLSSRGAMSKFNKALIKVMSEMRSKNLFVFICIPNFFILDWYPATHRSNGLVLVYKRGSFGAYNYDRKSTLYNKGKKFRQYCISPNFVGTFDKYLPLNKEKYEQKKQDAINSWVNYTTEDKTTEKEGDVSLEQSIDG